MNADFQRESLERRVEKLSKHLTESRQKDKSAKRAIAILINRLKRLEIWMKRSGRL